MDSASGVNLELVPGYVVDSTSLDEPGCGRSRRTSLHYTQMYAVQFTIYTHTLTPRKIYTLYHIHTVRRLTFDVQCTSNDVG